MQSLKRWLQIGLMSAGVIANSAHAKAAPPQPATQVTSIDLSAAFKTRPAWRFVASQGPATPDPFDSANEKLPGVIALCLQKDVSAPCDPAVRSALQTTLPNEPFDAPRYLNVARIVRPRGNSGPALLLLQIAGPHSGDGDQAVLTQMLAYDRARDGFHRVYDRMTGHNNNQEIRYVDGGPLAGDIISAEPTENAPFGFWVTVNALTPAYTYKAVLHYRSATTYEDGNPLPVIDSEMAGIRQRLGLWQPGTHLPLPESSCKKPHLVRMEIWCS